MRLVEFKFKIRVGRWAIELSNEDFGLWIGLWEYTSSSSSYPRWQWRVFRSRPVWMRREQVPVVEFVGARMVSGLIVEDEVPDSVLDAEVVE